MFVAVRKMDSNNDEATGSSNADRSWVTLGEVLKEQEELEAESDAVLGGSDDKNCTYSQVTLALIIHRMDFNFQRNY